MEELNDLLYLRELHLHVGKYMQEANNCIPQSAVS